MMNKIFSLIYNRLFSTSAAGLYLLLFAISIGVATFVENDFGTSAAQKMIFKTHWFELILVLFGLSVLANIFRFRLVQQRKWGTLTFHTAMIFILAGAGATRYLGGEGMMAIREGSASNYYLSGETYLEFQAQLEGKNYRIDEPVLFASLGDNHFSKQYLVGNHELIVGLKQFIPNPKESLVDDPNGGPILKVVFGGMNGREEFLIHYPETLNLYGTLFNFSDTEMPEAFNIHFANNNLTFKTRNTFSQMVMATQTRDTLSGGVEHPLKLRSMYSDGEHSFVFGDFNPKANSETSSTAAKMTSTSKAGLRFSVSLDGETRDLYITGSQGEEGAPGVAEFSKGAIAVAYGSRRVKLPFEIKLNDFIMERYPGTNSASSYASEITLVDSRNSLVKNQRIYMNHILNYDGFRFFQSSYDQDELGTYLSVNHDWLGTSISYLGYFLLTLGMALTLFTRSSRFRQLAENIKKIRTSGAASVILPLAAFFASYLPGYCGPPVSADKQISAAHAELFGRLLVQDQHGRLKPMNTFASEVVRKLSHKTSILGLTPEQVILGMASFPEDWSSIPMIKVAKQDDIRKLISFQGELASYSDFFDQNGEYKLKAAARTAFNMPARDRGVFEKEIVKLDEKVNICNMIFNGAFLKVFPVPGDTSNSWIAPTDIPQHPPGSTSNGGIAQQFYPMYIPALQESVDNGNWKLADRMVNELSRYQQKYGGAILPGEIRVNAEIWLNKLNIFNRLSGFYALLGLTFLVLLFTAVFNPRINLKKAGNVALALFLFGFSMHTLGLGLRWYVSGRAPWSNGYESMIYIAWTTTLAGLIFARKSYGGLAATAVLAATILMVAGMSWLDPEITPLVPVLKSYWLTIHVSMEAGSYGFLVLGAIIGVLNLIFMIFGNKRNGEKIYRIIREMTMISEMTLIGGLFMVSIGTYLGGVWANESWGRYWGWDAKETWALVTVLVYAFILHMRYIPGLRGLYAFNVATLFGWATVAMTYFGVNYYLSGLHSYAAGDPVPVPSFVYYIVTTLIILSLFARWKYGAYMKWSSKKK